MFTYIVLFNVPYDDWEVMLVTNNLNNAIEKVKNSKANCIQIWSFDELLNNFNFTKRFEWDSDIEFKDCFNKEINALIKYITDVSELNIRFKFYESDGTIVETKNYNRVAYQMSKANYEDLKIFIDDYMVCFSGSYIFDSITKRFINDLQNKLYEKRYMNKGKNY